MPVFSGEAGAQCVPINTPSWMIRAPDSTPGLKSSVCFWRLAMSPGAHLKIPRS